MARITLNEVIALVKQAPEYRAKWECGVPPEQAFYIRFADEARQSVTATVMPMVDGSDLVIDVNREGRVVGIEIA